MARVHDTCAADDNRRPRDVHACSDNAGAHTRTDTCANDVAADNQTSTHTSAHAGSDARPDSSTYARATATAAA